MSGLLSLSITTPLTSVLQAEAITSLRGEDASGGFGILPGHADFVTVIDAGILRWRSASGPWTYCAVRGGVFTVSHGSEVHVACREAITGTDLSSVQAGIDQSRAEHINNARRHRIRDAHLHARAIRRVMRELTLGGDAFGLEETGLDETGLSETGLSTKGPDSSASAHAENKT